MNRGSQMRLFFSLSWLVLTLSLGIWWWVLGLRQAETIAKLAPSSHALEQFTRVDTMLRWEGSFFLGLLGFGGLTLAFLSYRDMERTKLLGEFFSTLTHEMKTPLASLQLQLEGLAKNPKNKSILPNLMRLLQENQRIHSRMDKAFYLASLMRGEGLYLEVMEASDLLASLGLDYPGLQCKTESLELRGDRRALELILRNLVENSKTHGCSQNIRIHLQKTGQGTAEFQIEDDGIGFSGDWNLLGQPFVRLSKTSGTGIGLYICKSLIQKMGGKLWIPPRDHGFLVCFALPLA